MSRLKSRAGVTLIEILVAVSLLSLLTAGILITMHLGLNTMDKTDARLVHNRRVVNARKIIESEVDGFRFTMATFRPQIGTLRTITFFEAQPQSMRFVSSYSLQDAWRGQLQIAALRVVPGENNQGVRLILNEMPYTGPVQAGQSIAGIDQDPETHIQITRYAPPVVAGPESFVLADRLELCRFWYLEPERGAIPQSWRADWIRPEVLPLGIRIEMAPLDKTGADLHVSTVTVKLNVNLAPGAQYADGR